MYDIIVVGGGPAGMTAALYGLRAGKSVLVLEGNTFGGQITYSHRVENYPGIILMSGNEYADKLLDQIMTQGAEVELTKVIGIEKNEDHIRIITEDAEYTSESVIIATGATAKKLNVPGEERLTGAGVSYCAVCDGAFFKGEEVAVIGGGSTALSDAVYLSTYCKKVYVVHRRDEFRGEELILSRLKKTENVDFVLNSNVTEIKGRDFVESISVKNKLTSEEYDINVKGVFFAIGQKPANDFVQSIINLDANGYIDANEKCITNIPGVFVAGDCRKKEIRQLTTAVADGSIAAMAACKYLATL